LNGKQTQADKIVVWLDQMRARSDEGTWLTEEHLHQVIAESRA